MTDPTTSALIRTALALEERGYEHITRSAWVELIEAAAAYRAAHPEAGRGGDV